jgi:hypothetical protein
LRVVVGGVAVGVAVVVVVVVVVVVLVAVLLFATPAGSDALRLLPPYNVDYVPSTSHVTVSADPAEVPRLGRAHARLDIQMADRTTRRPPAHAV